jgi:hypothetical protein
MYMAGKSGRTGPLDAQGHVAKERVSAVVSSMLAFHANGAVWIPPGSAPDTRLYMPGNPDEPVMLRKMKSRKTPRAAVVKFADYVAERSFGKEPVSSWRRDVGDWLTGKRHISPDKLRRLSEAVECSWIEAFRAMGYYQHLAAFADLLCARKMMYETFVLAAFCYRAWSKAADPSQSLEAQLAANLADLDLATALYREVRRIEEASTRLKLWNTIPARVYVEDLATEQLRGVFRLCDPMEAKRLMLGSAGYPSRAVQVACASLVRNLMQKTFPYDPGDASSISAIIRTSLVNNQEK